MKVRDTEPAVGRRGEGIEPYTVCLLDHYRMTFLDGEIPNMINLIVEVTYERIVEIFA